MKDSFDHKDGKTVVLTPGFACLPHTMAYLGSQLKENFNVVYAPTHRANTVSIKVSSHELLQKMQQLKIDNENTSLVGHSMGGLIVIEAVKNAVNTRVNSIITISTPFQGTPMANLCSPFLKACEEINTPGGFHSKTDIGWKMEGILVSNVSEKDFIVPAGCQIPNKTIAPGKTKIIRHDTFDHKDGLVGDTCRTIASIVKKYSK